jgi:uncharacterized membrane protein
VTFPWRTALFISLALNLVLISAAIGAYATGARLARPAPERELGQRIAGQWAFMQALPPETRRALRRELGRELIDMREERAALRTARAALYEAARAEPYDSARVSAAFAAVRAADAVVIAGFHDALASSLARISAEDRAAALDALASGRPAPEDASVPADAPAGAAPSREERRERLRERWRERREQWRQQP